MASLACTFFAIRLFLPQSGFSISVLLRLFRLFIHILNLGFLAASISARIRSAHFLQGLLCLLLASIVELLRLAKLLLLLLLRGRLPIANCSVSVAICINK